jgi:hypothetical protein
MNWKEFERKLSRPERDTAGKFSRESEETTNVLSQDSWCPGQDSNQEHIPNENLQRYRYSELIGIKITLNSSSLLDDLRRH